MVIPSTLSLSSRAKPRGVWTVLPTTRLYTQPAGDSRWLSSYRGHPVPTTPPPLSPTPIGDLLGKLPLPWERVGVRANQPPSLSSYRGHPVPTPPPSSPTPIGDLLGKLPLPWERVGVRANQPLSLSSYRGHPVPTPPSSSPTPIGYPTQSHTPIHLTLHEHLFYYQYRVVQCKAFRLATLIGTQRGQTPAGIGGYLPLPVVKACCERERTGAPGRTRGRCMDSNSPGFAGRQWDRSDSHMPSTWTWRPTLCHGVSGPTG